MKGITVKEPGGPAIVHDRPKPHVRPGYMLIKTDTVALHPADIVVIDLKMATPGLLLGFDYAGTVMELGDDIKRPFRVGDRVCGMTRAADPANPDNGAYAEYIVAKADIQLHIPQSMPFEKVTGVGVAVSTVQRCLFDKFNIDYPLIGEDGKFVPPENPKRQILVYGGSSTIGTMVIQFAKLANFHVLATASSHNHELIRSFGADYVVDYHSENAVEDLISHVDANEETMGPLRFGMDCISLPPTAQFCARVLSKDPMLDLLSSQSGDSIQSQLGAAHAMKSIKGDAGEKIYSVLRPGTMPLPGITTVTTLGYSFLGEPFDHMGHKFPANFDDFASACRFAAIAESLIAEGKIRPHPVEVRSGGLQGIVDAGLQETRERKVSGRKLVYRLENSVENAEAALHALKLES